MSAEVYQTVLRAVAPTRPSPLSLAPAAQLRRLYGESAMLTFQGISPFPGSPPAAPALQHAVNFSRGGGEADPKGGCAREAPAPSGVDCRDSSEASGVKSRRSLGRGPDDPRRGEDSRARPRGESARAARAVLARPDGHTPFARAFGAALEERVAGGAAAPVLEAAERAAGIRRSSAPRIGRSTIEPIGDPRGAPPADRAAEAFRRLFEAHASEAEAAGCRTALLRQAESLAQIAAAETAAIEPEHGQ